VTEKERALLTKQKTTLDPTAFDKLVRDFEFECVLELPKEKKKVARRGQRGGRARGRGRGRGRR